MTHRSHSTVTLSRSGSLLLVAAMVIAWGLVVGCKAPRRVPPQGEQVGATASTAGRPSASEAGLCTNGGSGKAPSGTCGGGTEPSGCGAPEQEGCGLCGAAQGGADDRVRSVVEPSTGKRRQAVGADVATERVVSVAEALASGQSLVGQTVTIEGQVSAMCHHRRAWMALQDPSDRSGQWIRVVGTPRFLVPAGSVGKKARATGTLQVSSVTAQGATHLAQEHALSAPKQQFTLQALGADFEP
jgi:hypothetical protein